MKKMNNIKKKYRFKNNKEHYDQKVHKFMCL